MPQKKKISKYLQRHRRLLRLNRMTEEKKDSKCFTPAKLYPLYNTDEIFFSYFTASTSLQLALTSLYSQKLSSHLHLDILNSPLIKFHNSQGHLSVVNRSCEPLPQGFRILADHSGVKDLGSSNNIKLPRTRQTSIWEGSKASGEALW